MHTERMASLHGSDPSIMLCLESQANCLDLPDILGLDTVGNGVLSKLHPSFMPLINLEINDTLR